MPPRGEACRISATLALFVVFSLVLLRWVPPTGTRPKHTTQNRPLLHVSSAGDFHIGIFADLHFGEEEHGWGVEQDRKSLRVMERVLDEETLDLVVLNGDLITGENTFRENSSAYVHQIAEPLVKAGVPWASVYGNHDSDFNLSREAIFEAETEYATCYTDSMGDGLPGLTNYYVPVFAPEDGVGHQSHVPVLVLWFFDSRGGHQYQKNSPDGGILPDWVAPETAAWFTQTHDRLRRQYGTVVPSIAFVHIPPRVFLQAQDAGLDPSHYPGLNEDKPLAFQGSGLEDAAFARALLQTEGLHSVHVGHDHGDSWCSNWPGKSAGSDAPFLCFARHTGYGGYGSWHHGARILRATWASASDPPGRLYLETWVRMEDGRAIHRVSLNQTYGLDVYSPEIGPSRLD